MIKNKLIYLIIFYLFEFLLLLIQKIKINKREKASNLLTQKKNNIFIKEKIKSFLYQPRRLLLYSVSKEPN